LCSRRVKWTMRFGSRCSERLQWSLRAVGRLDALGRMERYVSKAHPEDAPSVGERVSRAKQPCCERQDTPTPQRSRADGAYALGDHPGGQHGKPADHAGRQAAAPDIDPPGSRLRDAAGGHESVDAMRHARRRSEEAEHEARSPEPARWPLPPPSAQPRHPRQQEGVDEEAYRGREHGSGGGRYVAVWVTPHGEQRPAQRGPRPAPSAEGRGRRGALFRTRPLPWC
jgi:hypothetical protein